MSARPLVSSLERTLRIRASGRRRRPRRSAATAPPGRRAEAAFAPASAWARAQSVIRSARARTASRSPSRASRLSPTAYRWSPASRRRSSSSVSTSRAATVVQEVALEDALQHERELVGARAPARPAAQADTSGPITSSRRERRAPGRSPRPRGQAVPAGARACVPPSPPASCAARPPRRPRRPQPPCGRCASSPCASDGNQASKGDGGRYTPRASISLKKAAKALASAARAPS